MTEHMISTVYILVGLWALIFRPAWVLRIWDGLVSAVKTMVGVVIDRERTLRRITGRTRPDLWSLHTLNQAERECGIEPSTEFLFPGHNPYRVPGAVSAQGRRHVKIFTAITPDGSVRMAECTRHHLLWLADHGVQCTQCDPAGAPAELDRRARASEHDGITARIF